MAKRKAHKKKKKIVAKPAAVKKPAKVAKKPAAISAPHTVDIAEELTEPVPHDAIADPVIAKALLVVIGVLLLVIGFYWWQSRQAQQQQINSQNQDQLLKVLPGLPDSLQPSGGTGQTGVQNSTSPQSNIGTGSDLQQQQQVTPTQLNQLQQ